MRYAVLSDVHGNLEAFKVVIDFYKKEKIDKFLYLGDIVGYGANPNECLSLLKDLNPICIAGNHDWGVVDKFSIEYFNIYAKEAILWTKKVLKDEGANYLKTFSLIYEENNFICVHSNLENPSGFYYIKNSDDALVNFSFLKKQICFIGHSHKREIYRLKGNDICRYIEGDVFVIEPNDKYIINVGSIGQPRDGDSRASLCIYDNQKNRVIFRRLDYDINRAAKKILHESLPSKLAERLYLGQ